MQRQDLVPASSQQGLTLDGLAARKSSEGKGLYPWGSAWSARSTWDKEIILAALVNALHALRAALEARRPGSALFWAAQDANPRQPTIDCLIATQSLLGCIPALCCYCCMCAALEHLKPFAYDMWESVGDLAVACDCCPAPDAMPSLRSGEALSRPARGSSLSAADPGSNREAARVILQNKPYQSEPVTST